MNRHTITPRANWQQIVESQGLTFHETDAGSTWDESAYYTLSPRDVERLEAATRSLHEMCLEAVHALVKNNELGRVGIPRAYRAWVAESWRRRDPSLYARFDLAFDAHASPKLLECNADTPTALVESAIIQWHWFQDHFPHLDQFNSLHERLIERWKQLSPTLGDRVHFLCTGTSEEDVMTVGYLQDLAMQAGLTPVFLPMHRLGWNIPSERFVDEAEQRIAAAFKLYPWEWMFDEPFGEHLHAAPTRWVEPPWKAVLSNKAILAVLWEMFPTSPYLLPASDKPLPGRCVRKPIHSREGCNIQVLEDGRVLEETPGPYGPPYIYQQFTTLPTFVGRRPIVGSWVVGNEPAGACIREDAGGIVTNTSPFIPHVIATAMPAPAPPVP